MSLAWESVLWVLMCQERLGMLTTIMAGGQLKGMSQEYKMELGDVEIDMTQPYTILLTKHGLKLFLMGCRKRRAFDVAKRFDIEIKHCLPASKEQDSLSQIMQAFKGEEMIHQFSIGKYRIHLYFPKYKLAIECDELDHRERDIGYEI